MNMAAKRHNGCGLLVKCISILLVAALCLIDVPMSFAAFNSISKTTFSASVTIDGIDPDPYPSRPDFYTQAYSYIKYFLDRAEGNNSAFAGLTRSFQLYLGGASQRCEDLIFSGASSYDQAILGRISLFNGNTTILDTYIDYYYQRTDPSNLLLKCSEGYTNGNTSRSVRIAGIRVVEGHIVLTLQNVAGALGYNIYGRNSLVSGQWEIIESDYPGSGGDTTQWTNPNNVSNSHSFYKAEVADENWGQILYGPYRIVRILNRDVPNWWDTWDWAVDTGAASVLIMYAVEAYDKTNYMPYKDFAVLLGDYMLKLQDSDGGLRYGPIGMHHDSGPEFFWKLKSTEQNERALYAFEALNRATGEPVYQQAVEAIKGWLKEMYNKDAHLFHSAAEYADGSWHKSDLETDTEYVATDVMALAPLDMMFTDEFFGTTQGQRDLEVDEMFSAIESRTAFFNENGKPVFFKFSVSQNDDAGNYGSVEVSSQMALAYLRAAQIHHDAGNSTKAAEYFDRYSTLIASLETFFKIPADDPLSKIAPYASYLNKMVASGVPTGTGFETYNCEAALASAYFAFARTGYIPYMHDGGPGIPNVEPVVLPSGDSDYDGIPDNYDDNPDDPYDAHEIGDDGFTSLEKYNLTARGINIFDETIGLNLTASVEEGTAPLDITFTATAQSGDIVKYEWDFDGNGTYDRWQYASKGNTVSYKYTADGDYNVRVRATTSIGKIDTASITITVSKPLAAPIAEVLEMEEWPVSNEFMIPTLQYLRGNGTASGSGEIVRYQWDTTGNGEYDISSTKSADASKTFNETISRIFTGSLKVTDSQGLSHIDLFNIMNNATNWDGSESRPIVYLNNSVAYGTPTSNVSLGGFGAPAAGNNYGYAKKLEWDFEGDGIYDWSSTLENSDWTGFADVTRKYGAPGVYRATLKAHTEANVSSYKTAIVIIEGPEPSVRANARVSESGGSIVTEIASGIVPIKATFDHLQSTGAVKYEWDFDGDKKIDYTTTDINASPVYYYTIPGYYVAMLRVTDSQGRIDTDYIPVFCVYPATYGSNIKMPKEGQAIAGNSVTLAADVFPDDAGVSSVMFQYSADSGATWINIGEGAPVMSYAKTWDTTLVPDGTYKLRAIVNSMDLPEFYSTSLTVNNSIPNPDVYENSNGTHVKKQVVDPSQANFVVLPDGTHIDIPYGALPDDGSLPVVTIEEVVVSGAGNTVDIKITGIDQFLQDVTISTPYPDADDNGIVDGTDIDENTIVLKWYNEDTGDWEVLYDSVVYPNENFVSAKVNHLSIFGWGIIGGAAAAAGGGSSSSSGSTASYCFIATAAYGTPMAGDVMTLRAFRDKYLLTNSAGKCFVDNYYKYSPPIADFISNKPVLRKIVRAMLRPLVWFAKALSLRAQAKQS
jgi:PKD repeat protein